LRSATPIRHADESPTWGRSWRKSSTGDLIESIAAPAKGAVTVWDNDPNGNSRPDPRQRPGARHRNKRIDRGEDPASQKRERREAPTIRDLVDRYIADHLPKKAAADDPARKNDEIRIVDLIGDALGWRSKVVDIHLGDLEVMHREITKTRGAVRANRVLAVASKAFSLSLKPLPGETKPWRDAAAGNPCKGVERNHEEGKERFFSEAEIAALSDALNEQEDRASADCLRFIMVTGCRPGEARKATWAQMELEPGYWVKPSAHTKQRKVHKVPLSPPALALLEQLREKRKPKEKNPHICRGSRERADRSGLGCLVRGARSRNHGALESSQC
jgi:integrase